MLTWAERVILYNQYEILKHLEPTEAVNFERSQEILASGLEQYYGRINQSVPRDTINRNASEEVEEIFDMYRAIGDSCDRLGYSPKSTWATFNGFDYNNDNDQTTVARYLIDIAGLWQELKDKPRNSHSSASLPHYRRMLEVWKRIGKPHELTAEQVESISEAIRRI